MLVALTHFFFLLKIFSIPHHSSPGHCMKNSQEMKKYIDKYQFVKEHFGIHLTPREESGI